MHRIFSHAVGQRYNALMSQPAILDTSVYRGRKLEAIKKILEEAKLTPYLSPMNVLEILGLRDGDNDFNVRAAAAKKMLEICSDGAKIRWVVDPEVFHCQLLGCNVIEYSFNDFEEALRRLVDAKDRIDLDSGDRFLNYKHARKVREEAYAAFRDKVANIRSAYRAWFDAEPKNKELFKEGNKDLIFAGLEGVHSFCQVRNTEFVRIMKIANTLRKEPQPVGMPNIGSPSPRLINGLNPYCELYIEYVAESIATGAFDENAFGDLQFAIYCSGGFIFVTEEKRWPLFAEYTSARGLIVSP